MALETLRSEVLTRPGVLTEVRMVLFSGTDLETYAAALAAL